MNTTTQNPAPNTNQTGLIESDMFTLGQAGDQPVLVWEARTAANTQPTLTWHPPQPVEVFFHTGANPQLQQEFTRQLDRQLTALCDLSAERLLEGINKYRNNGRTPTDSATKKARKKFMKKVERELKEKYGYSDLVAHEKVKQINKELVILHEPDQVVSGPGQPTLSSGDPSLGHAPTNSSIGPQNRSLATAIEQAATAIPPADRAHTRLNLRAILTNNPDLSKQLRTGQTHLNERSPQQQTATSPRQPEWTPAYLARTIHQHRSAWAPPTPTRKPPPTTTTKQHILTTIHTRATAIHATNQTRPPTRTPPTPQQPTR